VASPALGKQSSTKKPQQSADSSEGAQVQSPHSWGTLNSSVLDQLHEAVIATDLDGNITGGNQAILQIYEYSPAELLGKNLFFLTPEEEGGVLRGEVMADLQERGYCRTETRNRDKSGNEIHVELSFSLLRDANSVPSGIAVVVSDTAKRKLELASRQSQTKQSKPAGRAFSAEKPNPGLVQRQINETQFLIASPIMHQFMAMVDRVAAHTEIVLITGETGSGKELIARTVHDNSSRSSEPWVDINCAALPEQLVESELFGYEKGAFSGADSSKPGLFELADKGTLFLDEIGELDLKLQVKLLRVLDGATYYRLGGHRKITVDVRVVAATNQNLQAAVEEGRFRRDLFHRLGQFQLRVPPLRERPEDVVALAQHFLGLKDNRLKFTPDALGALACYNWPGNVRELRNLVAKIAMVASENEIRVDNLIEEISTEKRPTPGSFPTTTNLEGMEEQMIIKALENTGGHRGQAAQQLGISRRTLSRKLREYEIEVHDGDGARALGSLSNAQQKFFRAKTRFPVSLKNAQGNELNVTGVNLSSGGLGVDGLTDPKRFTGLLDCNFVLPESEALIQAKVRVVWADASGRAGIRFVVLEPALYEEVHHWIERKMKDEGWEVPQ